MGSATVGYFIIIIYLTYLLIPFNSCLDGICSNQNCLWALYRNPGPDLQKTSGKKTVTFNTNKRMDLIWGGSPDDLECYW